jgi:surfactin synthase thioesterase subunit
LPVSAMGFTSPWLVEGGGGVRALATLPRLFCFPHAGAGPGAFRGWSEAAAGSFAVSRVQLPGRESRLREPSCESMPELIRALADALRPVLTGRFAFFGHSLGATVAFELARELRRRGDPLPAALFVAGRQAPQLPWRHPGLRRLPDLQLLHAVQQRYGTVPTPMLEDAELRELLTPALRADLALVETYAYEPEPAFAFPILAFGGTADDMVTQADIEGWRNQTTDSFRARMLPGGHLFVADQRVVLLADMRATVHVNVEPSPELDRGQRGAWPPVPGDPVTGEL